MNNINTAMGRLYGSPRQISYAEDIRRKWHETFPQVQFPDVRWSRFWIDTKDETLDRLLERAAEQNGWDPFTSRFPRWGREEAVATLAGLSDFILLDIESTGIGKTADVVEIAIVRHAGADGQGVRVPLVLLDTLVRPPKVEAFNGSKAQEVNHIPVAELAKAPPLVKVWPKVAKLLTGQRVLAFNAEFDMRVLRNSAARQGIVVSPLHATCAMKLAAAYFELDFWPTLDESLKLAGMERPAEQREHRAAGDALVAVELVKRLRELSRQEGEYHVE